MGWILFLATVLLWVPSYGAGVGVISEDGPDWEEARQFWSFQSPVASDLPEVQNLGWVGQPLDRFILASMEKAGMAPAPEAGRETLIRRLTYTLTGLPPTPDEIQSFLDDAQSGAYERQVNRLMDSPRFGERLASLWLNLARYAEDQGHQVDGKTDQFYPNAHLYRQWVIDSFNRDLPYDRFVKLQLAADRFTEGDTNALVALGFLGLGPKYYNRGRLDVMADEWEDRVDTVARTFLGLTVACARCHDHKYDPITMEDYYGLAGVFASTRMENRSYLTPEEKQKMAQAEKDDKNKKKTPDNVHAMHIVKDGPVKNLPVYLRGDVENKGPEVPRRFLQVLCESEPVPFSDGSGRKELAEALVEPDNPLVARVMVNRLWKMVFGQGLVRTPSNFGQLGERPTHPELLDDLAVRFQKNNWSIKGMVREMVLSHTYRQSSAISSDQKRLDPGNRYYSRMDRRRLTAEMWRDSVLVASGNMDWRGGPSMELDDPSNQRRTVFARVSRLQLNEYLMHFDYPNANVHNAQRAVTITPLQNLFMLNGPFILGQSEALADRLLNQFAGPDGSPEIKSGVDFAYRLLYGRSATESETALARKFLTRGTTGADAPPQEEVRSRWTQYAQALLVSNEMIYLD